MAELSSLQKKSVFGQVFPLQKPDYAPLYSDLLIHDMGPALADGLPEGSASGRDWRTAPLLGIRHLAGLLHDGRAATVRDAILARDGEAADSRRRFLDLTEAEQRRLVTFVEGL